MEEIPRTVPHRKLNAVEWFLFFFPLAMALIGRFVMNYDKADMWGRLILIFMAFANGILEEILWRGVYFTLFPDNIRWGFVWPTLWFALWHLAPGSVSVSFSPWVLMAGAVVFGACWGWIAMKTDSIRWSALSHTLTALVRVLG
jgi:membrane protease YdiL (CAAX protease family)